jgi:hypothetical protein
MSDTVATFVFTVMLGKLEDSVKVWKLRPEVVGCDGIEDVRTMGLERVMDSAGRKL